MTSINCQISIIFNPTKVVPHDTRSNLAQRHNVQEQTISYQCLRLLFRLTNNLAVYNCRSDCIFLFIVDRIKVEIQVSLRFSTKTKEVQYFPVSTFFICVEKLTSILDFGFETKIEWTNDLRNECGSSLETFLYISIDIKERKVDKNS